MAWRPDGFLVSSPEKPLPMRAVPMTGTMSYSRIGSLFGAFAVVVATTLASPARADGDEGFDLTVDKGQVTVTARSDWHINQDYPWKFVMGDVKVDKSKFSLTEKTATLVDAPKGTGKLRGAVCSKDVCKMLEKEITVR
jgi:hypothetical protein